MKFLEVDITCIETDPQQVRKEFDEEALKSLSKSISEVGLINPISVRKKDDEQGKYIIVAGERRLRAFRNIMDDTAKATSDTKFKQIPVIVLDSEFHQEIMMIENVQREDLHPVELAEGLKVLKDTKEINQEKLATVIGKSPTMVSELLSITKLPKKILDEARKDKTLPQWVLVETAKAEDPKQQNKLWKTLKGGKITREQYRKKAEKTPSPTEKPPQLSSIAKTIKMATSCIRKTQDMELDAIKDADKKEFQDGVIGLWNELQAVAQKFGIDLKTTTDIKLAPETR